MNEVTDSSQRAKEGNKFDFSEWGGAFGDLGTLIPFVLGYITVGKMDPLGILLAFGILLIGSGLFYKTPIPVQPMKAIGGAAIAQAALVTPGMIWASGIFTGLFWLIMGLTGGINLVSKWAAKPVILGVMLGLGLSFMMEGIKMMQTDYVVASAALIITLFFIKNKHIPVMFMLIVFGIITELIREPSLLGVLSDIQFTLRMPHFALGTITFRDFVDGAIILAIPQIPLTLGNAVIAIVSENNCLFPERPVSEKKIAISQGLMNLIAPVVGGIPVCHGAGGMAGHVRFGARTGGSLIILGILLSFIALCFSQSVLLLFRIFPPSILGTILFLTGLELSVGIKGLQGNRDDYYVLLVTAGFAMWNMGVGFFAGLILHEMIERKIIQL